MRRVVITGIGALTPIGNNIPEYIEGLKKGTSGAVGMSDDGRTSQRKWCEM